VAEKSFGWKLMRDSWFLFDVRRTNPLPSSPKRGRGASSLTLPQRGEGNRICRPRRPPLPLGEGLGERGRRGAFRDAIWALWRAWVVVLSVALLAAFVGR